MEDQTNTEPTITPVPDCIKPTKVTKKRKKEAKKDITDPEVRKKARCLCSNIDEWKSISSFSDEKLQEFCEDKSFMNEHGLRSSINIFVRDVFAKCCDYIFGGDGHIENEMTNDDALSVSISEELSVFMYLMNNKIKLLSLTTRDIIEGRKKERLLRPLIDEENNHSDINDPSQLVQPDHSDQASSTSTDI